MSAKIPKGSTPAQIGKFRHHAMATYFQQHSRLGSDAVPSECLGHSTNLGELFRLVEELNAAAGKRLWAVQWKIDPVSGGTMDLCNLEIKAWKG